jgi:hypothetical protein
MKRAHVVASIASAAALVLSGSAAFASPTQASWNFDVQASTPGGGSIGTNPEATLTFTGAGTFTYDFDLEDHCPADGYGAALQFDLIYADGTFGFSNPFENTDGCTFHGGVKAFDGTLTRNKTIVSVKAELGDTHGGQGAIFSWGLDFSQKMINPHS